MVELDEAVETVCLLLSIKLTEFVSPNTLPSLFFPKQKFRSDTIKHLPDDPRGRTNDSIQYSKL